MVRKIIISILSLIPLFSFGQGGFFFNQHGVSLPIFGLDWVTTVDNLCDTNPWTITNHSLVIRYDITNSTNCGGTCSTIQAGTATADITIGDVDVYLNLTFEGVGELQSSNYEKIDFFLDDVLIASANAAGGSLGCAFGDVVKTYHVTPPYSLIKNTDHELFVNFTTNDGLYHEDCFYEITLSFSEQ